MKQPNKADGRLNGWRKPHGHGPRRCDWQLVPLQTRLTNARTEGIRRASGSATPPTTAAEYGWSALDATAERQRRTGSGPNTLQVARYRERHGVSGAKSDTADAHVLADMVRTDRHQSRPVAGDTDLAQAVKVLTRAHKTLIWDETRHTLRLRKALLEYFPTAVFAYADLAAADALAWLDAAPDPVSAGSLTDEQIAAALRAARRRNIDTRTEDPARLAH